MHGTIPRSRFAAPARRLALITLVVLVCCLVAWRWSHLVGGLSLAVALLAWVMPTPGSRDRQGRPDS